MRKKLWKNTIPLGMATLVFVCGLAILIYTPHNTAATDTSFIVQGYVWDLQGQPKTGTIIFKNLQNQQSTQVTLVGGYYSVDLTSLGTVSKGNEYEVTFEFNDIDASGISTRFVVTNANLQLASYLDFKIGPITLDATYRIGEFKHYYDSNGDDHWLITQYIGQITNAPQTIYYRGDYHIEYNIPNQPTVQRKIFFHTSIGDKVKKTTLDTYSTQTATFYANPTITKAGGVVDSYTFSRVGTYYLNGTFNCVPKFYHTGAQAWVRDSYIAVGILPTTVTSKCTVVVT